MLQNLSEMHCNWQMLSIHLGCLLKIFCMFFCHVQWANFLKHCVCKCICPHVVFLTCPVNFLLNSPTMVLEPGRHCKYANCCTFSTLYAMIVCRNFSGCTWQPEIQRTGLIWLKCMLNISCSMELQRFFLFDGNYRSTRNISCLQIEYVDTNFVNGILLQEINKETRGITCSWPESPYWFLATKFHSQIYHQILQSAENAHIIDIQNRFKMFSWKFLTIYYPREGHERLGDCPRCWTVLLFQEALMLLVQTTNIVTSGDRHRRPDQQMQLTHSEGQRYSCDK